MSTKSETKLEYIIENQRLREVNRDLLAALRRLAPEPELTRFESDRRCRFCGSNRKTHNDDCAWVQARTAIAKAEEN